MSAEVWWGMVTLDANGEGTLVFQDAQAEASVVSCYTSNSSTGPWIAVASETATTIACGLMNSGPDLLVMMIGADPYWYFLATLVKEGS